MARNALKLSTKVGENFEIGWLQMVGKALKLSTMDMVGEKIEISWSQMARQALKLTTMVGENFEICWHQMTRKALKIDHHCNVRGIINNNIKTDWISQIH